MTQIGFIRHGITDWNMEGRAQGQLDIPLNETGRKQARALAQRLSKEQWDFIYASDLSRARETAEIIAAELHLTVHTDRRLREMSWGEVEGTTLDDRIEKWGEDWRAMPLGIETDESISGRGISFADEISRLHFSKKVLAVSHGALLSRTLKQLIPQADTSEQLKNTSITIITFDGNRWDCERYNCTQHISNE